ncbi:sensor histidine kinase [Singulisphaera rosea]
MSGLLNWFAGNGRYMSLSHCMGDDWFWITSTVLLDFIIASGYVVIALHWRWNEAMLKQSPAKDALCYLKNIFVFCGLCGYIFIPVKMFWPAWRLYDVFLTVLAYYTWRYAWRARDLKVVYQELVRTVKLAEDLEQSREEGRRKSYFLNAISHDMKTPLNGMMLQAELADVSLDSEDPVAVREALSEIKACARTTANLLDRFLEIGRLDWSREPSQVERINVAEMLQQIVRQSRPHAELKGLRVLYECDESLFVSMDRLKVERILSNFIDNAIKFTEIGHIRMAAEQSDEGIQLVVEDTGEGIKPEDQTLIFDDFTQIHNRERDSRKGFGLGLGIARRLAHQLGGELSVESEPGAGSRFILSLPWPACRESPALAGVDGLSPTFAETSPAPFV